MRPRRIESAGTRWENIFLRTFAWRDKSAIPEIVRTSLRLTYKRNTIHFFGRNQSHQVPIKAQGRVAVRVGIC